jgi:hypothetical protein
MSLIRCPDCGKECSIHAASCPNCGRPLGRQRVQEGFLHKFARIIFAAVAAVIVGSCGFCCLGKKGDDSTRPANNTVATPAANPTPRVYDSVNTPTKSVYGTPSENSAITPPPTTVQPVDPMVRKEYEQAYKIGYRQGCIPDGLEVKNTSQVNILAQTAADFVHKPKNNAIWTRRWAEGFIKAYNKCHPDEPILTMSGTIAGQ